MNCHQKRNIMIKINDTFTSSYLTPGMTRDNFIFENCPIEFLEQAKVLLSRQDQQTISCVINLNKHTNKIIGTALELFDSDYHKKLVARDYVCSLIMKNLLTQTLPNKEVIDGLNVGLEAVENADKNAIMGYHSVAPMPYEITNFYRDIGPFELNFILEESQNVYVQQALNNFISSREPYSVKVFANGTLSTYLDQNKTPIENPHDYMKRNVQDFIERQNEKQ